MTDSQSKSEMRRQDVMNEDKINIKWIQVFPDGTKISGLILPAETPDEWLMNYYQREGYPLEKVISFDAYEAMRSRAELAEDYVIKCSSAIEHKKAIDEMRERAEAAEKDADYCRDQWNGATIYFQDAEKAKWDEQTKNAALLVRIKALRTVLIWAKDRLKGMENYSLITGTIYEITEALDADDKHGDV